MHVNLHLQTGNAHYFCDTETWILHLIAVLSIILVQIVECEKEHLEFANVDRSFHLKHFSTLVMECSKKPLMAHKVKKFIEWEGGTTNHSRNLVWMSRPSTTDATLP